MSNKETSGADQTGGQDPQKEPRKVPVMVNITNKRHFTNTVAMLGLLVSIIYAIVTYRIFRQNSDQFNVVNRPNLAIGHVGISRRDIGLPIHIDYDILNLGDHPVHTYYYKTRFDFDSIGIDDIQKIMKDEPVEVLNAFIVPRYPLSLSLTLSDSLTAKGIQKLDSAKNTLYIEFEYLNDFSDCWRTFILIVSLRPTNPNVIHRAFYNENRDTVISGRDVPKH